jgi:phospholipase C
VASKTEGKSIATRYQGWKGLFFFMNVRLRGIALVLAIALSACSQGPGGAASALAPVGAPDATTPVGKYIKHVVIIVQENRSFDNIFLCYPGSDCVHSGETHDGTVVKLHQTTFFSGDLNHTWAIAMNNWNGGKMNGFDLNTLGETGGGRPAGNFAYAYLDRKAVQPYWDMAQQYTLLDRMFPDMFGPSYTAHQSLIAGTTDISNTQAVIDIPTNLPWDCRSGPTNQTDLVALVAAGQPGYHVPMYNAGPPPCMTQYRTMADTLDAKHVSWKYYVPSVNVIGNDTWNAFEAIKSVAYGPDVSKITSPQTTVLTDAANGTLPQVSWVIPDREDSDHPSGHSNKGPSWVATVVNAIGKSQYWDSTAIIVTWDDWGGWFDHVNPQQMDPIGLGLRVPAIVISPYSRAHTVVHTQYEFGSILKFTEQVFDLAPLGGHSTDARSASLIDSFDFTQKPIKFKKFPVPETPEYFINRKPSNEPVDLE